MALTPNLGIVRSRTGSRCRLRRVSVYQGYDFDALLRKIQSSAMVLTTFFPVGLS